MQRVCRGPVGAQLEPVAGNVPDAGVYDGAVLQGHQYRVVDIELGAALRSLLGNGRSAQAFPGKPEIDYRRRAQLFAHSFTQSFRNIYCGLRCC